jgi:GDPmannose 4,6-dehydratase
MVKSGAKMKVLIFGASGQTGSYLSEQFIERGSIVYNLSRTRGSFSPPDSRFIQFDALNENDLLSILMKINPDIVINLLSMSSVYECAKNPELSKMLNCDFVLNVIDAVTKYEQIVGVPLKFLQASSSEMYSGYPAETVVSETTELKPLTTYGEHKTIAHLATLMRNQTDGNAQTVILFNHESPRRPQRFVSQKITKGLVSMKYGNIERLTLGNIHSRRDWGFADDYALGILKLIENQNFDSVILASGELHSVSEFIVEGAKFLGIENALKRIEIDPNLLRKKENDGLIGDSSKARHFLEWKQTVNFRELIQLMIDSEIQRRKTG